MLEDVQLIIKNYLFTFVIRFYKVYEDNFIEDLISSFMSVASKRKLRVLNERRVHFSLIYTYISICYIDNSQIKENFIPVKITPSHFSFINMVIQFFIVE